MNEFKFVIAVDFDGTCVEHEYPEVGKDAPGAVETLKWAVEQGHKLILWTMRSGTYLEDAKKWFEERGLPLWGVNTNPEQHTWTDSPKAYAHKYIDDAAVGCPLTFGKSRRPYADWEKIGQMLGKPA